MKHFWGTLVWQHFSYAFRNGRKDSSVNKLLEIPGIGGTGQNKAPRRKEGKNYKLCLSTFSSRKQGASRKLCLIVVKLLSILPLYQATCLYSDLILSLLENVFWDFSLFLLSSLQRIDPVMFVIPLEDQELYPGDENTSTWMWQDVFSSDVLNLVGCALLII